MTDPVDEQAPLEAVLKDEIVRMYQEVADNPARSSVSISTPRCASRSKRTRQRPGPGWNAR